MIHKINDNIIATYPSEDINFTHAFSKNPQSLDPLENKFFRHTDDRNQILIFLSGECEMRTDEYTRVLQPGDVCFNPAGSYYGINLIGNTPYERIVIHVKPNKRFEALTNEIFKDFGILNINPKQRLMPFIERYKDYQEALSMKQFSSFALCLIEELFYICLLEKNSASNVVNSAENLL